MEKILEVVFEIPEDILEGLKTGEYRRFGGIVRNLKGSVVAHLRETGQVELEQINNLLPQMQDQLKLLKWTSAVGAVSSVLNLTVSIAGFAYLAHKINKVEKRLETMEAKLDVVLEVVKELKLLDEIKIKAKLKNATSLAERALKRHLSEEGKRDLYDASSLFSEIKAYYGLLVESLIKGGKALPLYNVLYEYISLYMLSVIGEVNCRLYLNDFIAANFEMEFAIQFLNNIMESINEEFNIFNPNFVALSSKEIPDIKSKRSQLVEMGQRLESFQQEVHFIEANKIDYLEWQSLDVPADTVSPFLVLRPKQERGDRNLLSREIIFLNSNSSPAEGKPLHSFKSC